MLLITIVFLFFPAIMLFGYQSMLESKGVNDPTLAISLYKTYILLDIPIKLLLFCFIPELDVFSLTCVFIEMAFCVWFYADLSLKIPKTSLRKYRKFPQDTNYTICALKVIGWCILTTFFNVLLILFRSGDYEDPIVFYVLCLLIVILMFFYMSIIAKTLIRLDRLKYPSTRSLTALAHNNSPVVLLRSFKIDSNPTIQGKVFDETICESLDLDKNPIVSLGNPDEILPSGGSLKIQAKDSEWKEVVAEMLKNCRAVILVEGLSDGLHWEISKIKEYLSHEQLYVLVPVKVYRELAWCYNDEAGGGLYSIIRNAHHLISKLTFTGKKDRERILNSIWADFTSKLHEYGIHTPGQFPGNDCLISFDENWNAIVQPSLSTMDMKLKYILSHTANFNSFDFDYPKLGEKIASFEVNGFLDMKEVVPFKALVDKFNRIGKIATWVAFVLFVLVLLLVF